MNTCCSRIAFSQPHHEGFNPSVGDWLRNRQALTHMGTWSRLAHKEVEVGSGQEVVYFELDTGLKLF